MSGIIAQNTLDNSGLIKSPAGGGAWNFISKQTASADATIDFTSGIDSTYKLYIFKFFNINAATNVAEFGFQANASGESGYNETMQTTYYLAYHNTTDTNSGLDYSAAFDLNGGTGIQTLAQDVGSGAYENTNGTLFVFNPSSTVFSTQFYSRSTTLNGDDYACDAFASGYFSTTAALTNFTFKFSTGNITAGTVKMYGL